MLNLKSSRSAVLATMAVIMFAIVAYTVATVSQNDVSGPCAKVNAQQAKADRAFMEANRDGVLELSDLRPSAGRLTTGAIEFSEARCTYRVVVDSMQKDPPPGEVGPPQSTTSPTPPQQPIPTIIPSGYAQFPAGFPVIYTQGGEPHLLQLDEWCRSLEVPTVETTVDGNVVHIDCTDDQFG